MPISVPIFVIDKLVASKEGASNERSTQLGLIGSVLPLGLIPSLIITQTIARREAESSPQITTGTISGQVTDTTANNAGVPNVQVEAILTQGTTTTISQVTTDTSGNYSFSNVNPGSYTILIPAQAGKQAPDILVTVSAGQTATANFPLTLIPTTGTISGQVTGGTSSAGLPNVPVTATLTTGTPTIVTTDTNGNYTFSSLPPGNYTVSINLVGIPFPTPAPQTINLMPGATVGNINFQLTLFGTISGQVTAGTLSAGVPNVPVTLTTGLTGGGATFSGQVNTDPNGNYIFSSLPPHSYTISVTPPAGMPTPAPQTVNLMPGATVSNINFQLTPTTGTISGRVTDATANNVGVQGIQVTATPADGTTPTVNNSDANGDYSFPSLNPGNYTISIQAPAGKQAADVPVTVTAGQTTAANFLLIAAPATGTISGQVTDTTANNVGVAGVQVTATPAQGTVPSPVISDASGNYSFSNVPPGSYRISIQAPAGKQAPAVSITVTAGQTAAANFPLT